MFDELNKILILKTKFCLKRHNSTSIKITVIHDLVNDGMTGDGGEVTNKFSELHEKLGKCHLNTYIWSLPLIALNVIGIVVIFYLRDIHQIQCLHEKYCNELNQTVPRRGFPLSGNCPWYLDIPPDCCVAFCYRY